MAANFSILLFVFAVSAPGLATAMMEESYVRVQQEPDGSRIVLLMDSHERIVSTHFGKEGNVLDCHVAKRNEIGKLLIVFEVVSTSWP